MKFLHLPCAFCAMALPGALAGWGAGPLPAATGNATWLPHNPPLGQNRGYEGPPVSPGGRLVPVSSRTLTRGERRIGPAAVASSGKKQIADGSHSETRQSSTNSALLQIRKRTAALNYLMSEVFDASQTGRHVSEEVNRDLVRRLERNSEGLKMMRRRRSHYGPDLVFTEKARAYQCQIGQEMGLLSYMRYEFAGLEGIFKKMFQRALAGAGADKKSYNCGKVLQKMQPIKDGGDEARHGIGNAHFFARRIQRTCKNVNKMLRVIEKEIEKCKNGTETQPSFYIGYGHMVIHALWDLKWLAEPLVDGNALNFEDPLGYDD